MKVVNNQGYTVRDTVQLCIKQLFNISINDKVIKKIRSYYREIDRETEKLTNCLIKLLLIEQLVQVPIVCK